MLHKITILALSFIAFLAFCQPGHAQTAQYDLSNMTIASGGTQGNMTYKSGGGPADFHTQVPNPTGLNNAVGLLPTTRCGLAPVFGLTGYGWASNGSNGASGLGTATAIGNLASFNQTLPGSNFAAAHPRRTEVLENDSNIYNQINADAGHLGGNYNQLASTATAIQTQEEGYAANNGGYITTAQQAQLNQEEAALSQQVAADYNPNQVPGF